MHIIWLDSPYKFTGLQKFFRVKNIPHRQRRVPLFLLGSI